MTALSEQQAPSVADYLAEAGPRLANLCTACGACFTACPIAAHIGLGAADGAAVTAGMRALATGSTTGGQPASADAVAWVGACAKSGLCVEACPHKDSGLDAMLLIRIAKQQALATGQLKTKYDLAQFPRLRVFAALQLTDEEQKAWL